MNNLEKAKDILKNQNKTCVLCNGSTVYTSEKNGISPMLEFLNDKTELKGFSAADKIIGKAAALLFVKSGVTEVFGEVMSRAAVLVLSENGIKYSYDMLTEIIINRSGDGICPMEKTVEDIDNPDEADAALREKLHQLSGGDSKNRE